jgi:16S rRNA (guanine966-N2)-methyltransferase
MRIIGGKAARRRIKAPPGAETRPTADRVREAVFNILGPPPDGARVLDLYAGAGGLGLEALSRGAESAVFVDRSRQATRVLTENAAALAMTDASEIHCADGLRALRRLEAAGRRFDWVFVDPPYHSDLGERALAILGEATLLAPGAVVVVEHDRRRPPAPAVGCLVKADSRRYGDTEVAFYRRRER